MASSMYFVPTANNSQHTHLVMNNSTHQLSTPTTTATPSTFHGGSRGSSGLGGVREWIKLVGLPYTASEKDVRDFLCEFCIPERDAVFFVVSAGKPCGRAYVHMRSADEAAQAARELNKQYLGARYIDVRQIALREVQRELREVACRQESINYDSDSMPVGVDRSIRNPVPFLPQQRAGNCVKLVGLPFTCTEQQISDFMEGVKIRQGGVHFMTRNGKPSGNCVVELEDPLEAYKAVTRGHKKYLGRRFVEVYLARPCDLFCDADELKSNVRLHPLPDTITNEELANILYGLELPSPSSMTLMAGQSTNTVEAYLVFDDEETASMVMLSLARHYPIDKISLGTAHAYKAAMAKRRPIQHNSPAPTPDAHTQFAMMHMADHHGHIHGVHAPFSITPVPFSCQSPSDTSSDATRPPSPMNDGEGKHDGHVVFTHDPYSLERFASTESDCYYSCDSDDYERTPYSAMGVTTPPQPQAQLLHSLITSCY